MKFLNLYEGIKPGIYPDIPEAEYHKGPGLSKSQALEIRPPNMPCDFAAAMNGAKKRKETQAMRLGSAVHQYLLDGTIKGYEPRPDWLNLRKPDHRQWVEDKKKEGVTILTQEEYDAVRSIPMAVSRHAYAAKIVKAARTEVSIYAKDPETGILLRCRVDIDPGGNVIADLKKSRTVSQRDWTRQAAQLDYHIQAAWYLNVCRLAGIDKEVFLHIAVEAEPPYNVRVFRIPEQAVEDAQAVCRRLIGRIHACSVTGEWPGYDEEGLVQLDWPEWKRNEDSGIIMEDITV